MDCTTILEYRGLIFEQDENGDYRKTGDTRSFSHVSRAYQSWIDRTSEPNIIWTTTKTKYLDNNK